MCRMAGVLYGAAVAPLAHRVYADTVLLGQLSIRTTGLPGEIRMFISRHATTHLALGLHVLGAVLLGGCGHGNDRQLRNFFFAQGNNVLQA